MTDDSNPKGKITRLMGQTIPSQPKTPSITQSGRGNVIAFGNVSLVQDRPRAPRATVPTSPGVEHISDSQKVVLKDLVDEIIATEARLKKSPASYSAVWKTLNKKCGVTTYHLIALEDFDAARTYLNSWLGRLNSMRSAPVKNGDAWRKKKYAYIKINSKHPDDAQALAAHIKKKFDVESITELANDELEKVYQFAARLRNKRR